MFTKIGNRLYSLHSTISIVLGYFTQTKRQYIKEKEWQVYQINLTTCKMMQQKQNGKILKKHYWR